MNWIRPLAVVLVFLSACLAAPDPRSARAAEIRPADLVLLDRALKAVEKNRIADAERQKSRLDDGLARDLVAWFDYRRPRTKASFEEIASFLERNGDWPETGRLRVHAEQKLPGDKVQPERLLRFFDRYPALTRFGRTAHIEALTATGATAEATALIRRVWIETNFPSTAERAFRQAYGDTLRREDHIARLDRLAWDAKGRQIERMRRLVPQAQHLLADARLALRQLSPGVDGKIARVPQDLRSHPGLVFERARWRRLKGRNESARDLLWNNAESGAAIRAFWRERHFHVRDALHEGAVSQAYVIAKGHGFESGLPFAQGEFLAGWTALRFLMEPNQALGHFIQLFEGVSTPISRSRAAYWAGRAAEAAGLESEAVGWYERAARHGTTFYGQLAAHTLNRTPPIQAGPKPTPAQISGILKRPLGRGATMLTLIDRRDLAEDFMRALGLGLNQAGDRIAAIRYARELGLPGLSVALARSAASDGIVSLEDAFPVSGLIDPGNPEPALVHAIIRQESLFDPRAVSGAGARGLMQILPATARQEAKRQGLGFSRTRLLADPEYNIRLGRGYLQGLLERYDGHYAMAIAAYNAGPGRVEQWIQEFGDPRRPDVDVIDWIELIPFSETRNYVQRVLEGLTVYRMTLDDPPLAEDPALARAVWCLTGCERVFSSEEPIR
ncbi:MAG: lytic transglycosylase domain-containing protein [Alphaproteobacteria bacterium]|nr:lytic transglycosylase domain-containing protein [Alphaproteobacteria bacterium]